MIAVMADPDAPEPPSAKVIEALLREARALSHRAERMAASADAVPDPTLAALAAETRTGAQHLVHHLMVLGAQQKRRTNPARGRDR
jgi:hypothetical protein